MVHGTPAPPHWHGWQAPAMQFSPSRQVIVTLHDWPTPAPGVVVGPESA
jgi:hypothetical protein